MTTLTDKRIMLTGGSGMVGRNLLEHPVFSKFNISAPGSRELNLFDREAVEAYVAELRPDIIIHAAGRVGGIQANLRAPAAFLIENMDMGRNLVWAAKNCGVKRLLNLGTSCMYPRNTVNPLAEETILQGELEPTNEGYAIAKIVVSKLCSYISREYPEFLYKTLIPCNLYGRWDKFAPEHSHMIPAVIRKLHMAKVNGDKTVSIWGDGTARREFMYAGDLADCICRAINGFESIPELMNVGIGTDYTIDEYYRTIAEIVGFRGSFTHDTAKPAGMARKLLDVSRQSAWNWSPKIALKDGVARTYEFFMAHAADR